MFTQEKLQYKLEEDLKRRNFDSSHLVAERVIDFFTKYIRNAMKDKDVTPAQVIKQVEQIGSRLRDCDRLNFIVPNTTKRCLHILRQACK